MKFLLVYFSLFAISIHSIAGQHSLKPTLLGHLEQHNDLGLSIFYSYALSQAFDLELGYLESGELEVTTDQTSHFGQYKSVLIGTSLQKQYNKQLQLKAGAGLNWLVHSSNQQLIEQDSLNPYLKFSAQYAFNNSFSVELGQLSQLSSGQLDVHHALFFSVNYTFGNKSKRAVRREQGNQEEGRAPLESTELSPNLTAKQGYAQEVTTKPLENKSPSFWTVQVAAFASLTNAEAFIGKLASQAKEYDEFSCRIIKHKGNYLVLTGSFTNYSKAKFHQETIEKAFKLRGFSKFIDSEN